MAAAPSLKRKAAPSGDDDDDDNDHVHLAALDHIFKRIKTAVPRVPYVLSTPSLHPYHCHSRQEANAWIVGHLWRPEEAALQYRTFLYRLPCQDCFELVAGDHVDDDNDHHDPPASRPTPRAAASAATVAAAASQPVRRKPDLSAFKVKPAHPRPAPPKHAPDPPHGTAKPESTAQTVAVIATAPVAQPSAQSPTAQTAPVKPEAPSATPHGLPPLLSPVQEPLGQPHGLPAILSPTLPPTIQAELDRLDDQNKRAESNTSASSDRKSKPPAVPPPPPPLPPPCQKPNGSLQTENRPRSVSANGSTPQPVPVRTGEEPDRTPALVVKLNFSKDKARTVKSLLRLPPKKKPENHESHAVAIEPPVIKRKQIPKVAALPSDTPPPGSEKSKIAPRIPDKRPRAEEEVQPAVPSKRPRRLSQQDCPVTPVPASSASASSNKPSNSQTRQTTYITPRKEAKGASMLRAASSESHEVTPGRSGATPGAKADPKAGPTSAPLVGKKQADITLLGQMSMKLNQMGRSLKHEATKILTAGTKIDKQDAKRAAVTNLECILSYMAAYYAQDLSLHLRNRPGEVEQTWKTLLPLCISYARCTKDFTHLDGLRSYLSSIIASAICTHVAQRAFSTRPHDSPHDMPHADLAKQHTSIADNFALLADHTLKMSRHFQDARIALPACDLQALYKKTWAGRETNMKLVREPDKTSAASLLTGPYFLPLGVDATPVQAVRFGLAFLREYCDKEGISYRLRVSLERPD